MLREQDKDWIERAIEKELTTLQIKKKLKASNYTDEKIEEFLKYYEEIKPKDEQELPDIEDEENFKKSIKTYFKDKSKLSWKERREIEKWMKNLKKATKTLEMAINALKKEYNYIIENQDKKGYKIEKELEDVKEEIIDRIMDSKELLYVEDPLTGEEATKESLMNCNIDELIKLMEENVIVLTETIEGKIDRSEENA